MTAPLGNVKASVPPEQLKAKMNPGDVSFLGFERKDNVFTVTFAWIDMIGGHHEHTFARGDIFADFNKVLKVFTDGGLPIDPAKADDFHMRLCQLSTVMVQEQAPAAKAEAKKRKHLLNNALNTQLRFGLPLLAAISFFVASQKSCIVLRASRPSTAIL